MKNRPIRTLAVLLAVLMLAAMTACGKENGPGKVVGAPEEGKHYLTSDGRLYYLSKDLSQYITFSAYTGLSVTVSGKEADDSAAESIRQLAKSYATVSSSKTVEENDTVVCDFVGTADGKQFTSESNVQIEIRDGSFEEIPGLADKLIGSAAGKTCRVSLTLPDDYSDTKYAGRPAEFEVKIKYVITPSLTDENVSSYTYGAYKTIAEYQAYLRDQAYRGAAITALIEKIREGASFPTDLTGAVEQCYQDTVSLLTANSGAASYEEYLKESGKTDDDIRKLARETYEYNLTMYYLVQVTGIQVYETEYRAKFNDFTDTYMARQTAVGSSISREDAEKYVNENSELVISACLEEKVFNFLLTNNQVVEE